MTAGRFLAAALASAFTTIAAAQTYDVRAELWDRPRTAAAVAADEGVRQAVLEILARPQARLAIRHRAGQEPLLHAEELRSWLGALAVDPRRIELRSELSAGAPLTLEIIR